MTLHAAIEKLLSETRRPMTTQEIADKLNQNKWYQKRDGTTITAFQIHGRTRKYSHLFNRNGITVSLAGQEPLTAVKQKTVVEKSDVKISTKDEHYVLDLCDTVLKCTSLRQHRFDFLLGDTNGRGSCVKLPVDAYYQKFKLVVEYRERQHTESVSFFDKPSRMTVSGVHRGEQRKIYDERRRTLIPKNGLTLVEISYSDFNYDSQKRIIRDKAYDTKIVRNILQAHIEGL